MDNKISINWEKTHPVKRIQEDLTQFIDDSANQALEQSAPQPEISNVVVNRGSLGLLSSGINQLPASPVRVGPAPVSVYPEPNRVVAQVVPDEPEMVSKPYPLPHRAEPVQEIVQPPQEIVYAPQKHVTFAPQPVQQRFISDNQQNVRKFVPNQPQVSQIPQMQQPQQPQKEYTYRKDPITGNFYAIPVEEEYYDSEDEDATEDEDDKSAIQQVKMPVSKERELVKQFMLMQGNVAVEVKDDNTESAFTMDWKKMALVASLILPKLLGF
jgi:hypothetical protein